MAKKTTEAQDAEKVSQELVPQVTFQTMPATIQDAIKLSEMIAASDLAPKDFKGKSGNCYIAIQMGAEVGLGPMQAIQNIAVINGKPTLYGDIGKALLLSKGCRIMERDMKDVKATGEAWCEITRPDGKTKIVRTFSVADAQEAGLWKKPGPWTNYPYRQMAWRAFWFAARDGAADFLKGLAGAEEVRDYVETELVQPIPAPTRQSKAKEPPLEGHGEAGNGAPEADHPVDEGNIPPNAGNESQEPLKLKVGAGWIAMVAKRESPCEDCADEVMIGDKVYWDAKSKRTHHAGHFA